MVVKFSDSSLYKINVNLIHFCVCRHVGSALMIVILTGFGDNIVLSSF